MKLTYSTAIVGFCPDLTNPAAEAVPLAVVLIGKTEGGQWWLAGVGARKVRLELDPISAQVLGDVPRLLTDYLDRTLDRTRPDADVEVALHGLHNSLRNSLSVLEIRAAQERQVPDDLQQAALVVLTESMRGVWKEEEKPRPSERRSTRPAVATRRHRETTFTFFEREPNSAACPA